MEQFEGVGFSIYKLSHGTKEFAAVERRHLLQERLAVMHRDTPLSQGQRFLEVPVGTLFHLCHSNSPQQIGQFISDPKPIEKGEGWVQRSYRVLKNAVRHDPYEENRKKWSPGGNSTFWRVGEEDLDEFEKTFLRPYFETDLAELRILMKAPINTGGKKLTTAQIASDSIAAGNALFKFINRIYYGPPGTGKTWQLTQELKAFYTDADTGEQRHSFVTFHQSYGYEEFVEGLRPVLEDEAEAETKSGEVRYRIRPGVFKELCRKARSAPHQRFAMVIDEINRGNISKIFGELITLIETDKREGAEHAVTVTLPYSGEPFSVPPNVDIIGTMNTADRSLALLDTALRRRFEFVPCMPNTSKDDKAPLKELKINVEGHEIDVRLLLKKINQRIEALYDRDHTIGHAYFTPLKNVENGEKRFKALGETFKGKILPLLEEYFFEDWQKIRLVLADNQKEKRDPATCFVAVKEEPGGDLDGLFGSDHGLDAYATKPRFELQDKAFDDPRSYIGIYDATAV